MNNAPFPIPVKCPISMLILCILSVFSVAKLFALCFFFHLGIADSKQEVFQKWKWSDTIFYYFVVKFALLCSLDNFCQHCYSELIPTT